MKKGSLDNMIQNNLVCPATEKKLINRSKVKNSSIDMLVNVSNLDMSVANDYRSRDRLKHDDKTGRDMSLVNEVIDEAS